MLYGKWRPQGFDEVVGQDHVVSTLRNALATGQVAHAYLFSGPRGTGKTTTARILARAVNCLAIKDGHPCNSCPPCIAITNGSALDLVEMDAASNRGIDEIRDLRERINFVPSDLTKKVYLLDEAHMLTGPAFNAFLKTLEEPPPHAIFILATTEVHKLPATILSRCQRYEFRRVDNNAMTGRLQTICASEGFNVPSEGLLAIALQARGGMRDAITLLEQVVARYGNAPSTDDCLLALGLVRDERSETLARAIVEEDLGAALDIARQVADDGLDVARFTREAIDVLREVLLGALRREAAGEYAALIKLAAERGTTAASVARSIEALAEADFRLDPASPVPLEVACATAILAPAAVAQAPVAAPAAQQAGRPPAPQQVRNVRGEAPQPMTENERFLQSLRDMVRMVDVRVAAKLHEATVETITDDEVCFGVYYQFHLDSLEREGRPLLEDRAIAILGRPVRLTFRLADRPSGGRQRAPAKKGHLAETALEVGAVPVGKDQN